MDNILLDETKTVLKIVGKFLDTEICHLYYDILKI